jgi:hypothetical protein
MIDRATPEAPSSSAMAILWRNQARYCRVLAANNQDPRIRAALIRMARRLSARASAALSSSGISVAVRPRPASVRIASIVERRDAQKLLGDGRWGPVTPLQNVALVELARVQTQIVALEAERPPERSARANIVSVLYRKKAQLERVLAVAPPKPPGRRRAARRPEPHGA